MELFLAFPFTLITQGIYTGLINTISTITFGTCKLISSLYSHKNPNVNKILLKLDIEQRLILIESVLRKIENHKNLLKDSLCHLDKDLKNTHQDKNSTKHYEKIMHLKIIEDHQINENYDPIELALIFLKDTIHRIHLCLEEIDEKINKHNHKWFNYWRSLNLDKQLNDLEILSSTLDKRFDYLLKITDFLKNYDIVTHHLLKNLNL
jgi:hypothetical protein